MSELEFPAEVEERATSGAVALDDHEVDEDDDDDDGGGTRHVINNNNNNNNNKRPFLKNLYEMKHHQHHQNNHHHHYDAHVTSSDNEYAGDDYDGDDNYQDEKLSEDKLIRDVAEDPLAASTTRSRLSRLKSERLRLIEEVKNERKRYEKYLDKLTCQLFKVLLSQKKLKSDCSSLIERVSALETDNKRLKEALDKWSDQAKELNSSHHPNVIQPFNYLVKRPTSPNPNFIDFSSISDQPHTGQKFDGHSELCFFFHTHPPFLGQAIASLRRLKLFPPTFQCSHCDGSKTEASARQQSQNDYYNIDSLNRWLAKDGDYEVKQDDAAWKGSTYSVLYDDVYGEGGFSGDAGVRNRSTTNHELPIHDNGSCSCTANNGWMEGMSRKTKFDNDEEVEEMEAHYDEVADNLHHHHHSDINYQNHDQDYFHDYQDDHQTLGNQMEYKENPYQNLTNSISDIRGSSTATYSTTIEGDQQSYMTNFSATTLAPLSRSFYYTPGGYSSNHGSAVESKMENSPSTRRLQSKIKEKSARFSFNSEISNHLDCNYDDSLEECHGQFKTISPDGRFPSTAMYRIKNANVARLVPIDRAIAEDFDEVNELNCHIDSIDSCDDRSKRWKDGDLYEARDPQIKNEQSECDAIFSCPWKLRLDQNYHETYSTTFDEDPNIFEDECGDYAKLTKPIQKFSKRQDDTKISDSLRNCIKEEEKFEKSILSNSSKFLNAFGFLLSQNIQSVNSQFLLNDLVTEMDHFPSNSMSLSCLSLSPTSVDKAESLFESSSACLTDALGRSMDESSLSSFFVFESSAAQGFPSNSSTVIRDDDATDYMALLNRNTSNAKSKCPDSSKPTTNGFEKLSETSSHINFIRNSIKPKLKDKNQKNSNMKQFKNVDKTKSPHKYENQFYPTQHYNPTLPSNSQITNPIANTAKSNQSSVTPIRNNSPIKSSSSKIHQSCLPSPVLRRANLFQNSKIPGSPKSSSTSTSNSSIIITTSTTALNASNIGNQTINTSNSLHTSISVPFRQQSATSKQNTRNSLPPLNQMRTPTIKSTVGTGKTGGFFRFNSKLLGSTAAKPTEAGQSVKTSPKMSPKTERSSIFKFSSPKLKRSSLAQQGSTEGTNQLATPPAEKRNVVCKTV